MSFTLIVDKLESNRIFRGFFINREKVILWSSVEKSFSVYKIKVIVLEDGGVVCTLSFLHEDPHKIIKESRIGPRNFFIGVIY